MNNYIHSPNIIPSKPTVGGFILCKTKDDKYLLFDTDVIKFWEWIVTDKDIEWWAFCEDIEYMLKNYEDK